MASLVSSFLFLYSAKYLPTPKRLGHKFEGSMQKSAWSRYASIVPVCIPKFLISRISSAYAFLIVSISIFRSWNSYILFLQLFICFCCFSLRDLFIYFFLFKNLYCLSVLCFKVFLFFFFHQLLEYSEPTVVWLPGSGGDILSCVLLCFFNTDI